MDYLNLIDESIFRLRDLLQAQSLEIEEMKERIKALENRKDYDFLNRCFRL